MLLIIPVQQEVARETSMPPLLKNCVFLEWIQVSQRHRGKGLGRYVVSELLRRLKSKAGFATVSGQCNNATNPEMLYRKCGFSGNDVWHILRKA